ncbi:MAG TPA: TonB-dependent receptor [Steroidobacteraceae bacterium]|nr:TonB-dependent receptor [Steroidobacteraceae bacterium]
MNRGFAAGLRRSRFLPTLLLSLAACAGARGQAAARDFHIAAQDAASALAEFGAQSQMQLLFDYEAVQGVRTHALRGQWEVPEALGKLLADTGLSFTLINERTVSIVRAEPPSTAAGRNGPRATAPLAKRTDIGRSTSSATLVGVSVATALDEIVVSAEKRDQALQHSALAVTALPSRVLERQQVSDLKSVTTLIPNLQIGLSSTQAAFDLALRGIVSTNRTEVGDAAVAFHVDGFYSPRPQGATIQLYDTDRLEALRGPQGTLFGRNANAGVINVVSAKPVPGETFGALDLTLGNYDLQRLKGYFNLPVGDALALRAAAFVEKRDGYISFLPGSNVTSSTPRYDDSDKSGFRLSGLWEPSEAWTMFASAEHYADHGAGTIPVSLAPADGHALRSALITSPGKLDLTNDTFHFRTDLRAGGVEASYLFGYASMTRENVSDQDVGVAQDPVLRALPEPPLQPTYDEERRTDASEFISTQHELQIKPLETGRFDWIAGAFFYQENNSIRFDVDVRDDRGSVPGAPDAGDVRYSQVFLQPDRSLASWAGFGQVTWNLAGHSRLSAGARYTEDSKQDRGGVNLVCPAPNATIGSGGFNVDGIATDDLPMSPDPDSPTPVPGTCRITAHNDADKRWSKLTYMARFEYDFGARVLGYALTNSGFKSGVIQDGGTFADPEEVVNYEIGLKATLLDGDMALNTVGFYSNYSDILRTSIEWDSNGVHQLVTRNATRARIYGIESELLWKPAPRDVLQGVVTFLSAEYLDYPTVDSQYYVANDPLTPVINLSGNTLPFAPEFTVALVYEHSFPLANGTRLVPRLQTKYQSEMFLTDFNRPSDSQDAYTRTDLSLRYESGAAWMLEAYVQNLEDEAVKNNVDLRGNQPGSGGVAGFPGVARAFLDPPRTYGVRAAYRFGE